MTRRPTWISRHEEVIDEHTAPDPGDRKYATGPEAHTTDPDALRHEQQEEIAQSWFGVGFLTDAQLKGGVVGTVAGGLVGALLFLPLGFIGWGGLALGWRMAVAALCGALAGSTALAIYMGGREPELEGETLDVDQRPSDGTTLRDPHSDERGR
ncbi:MAG: hypothetical protein PV358_17155 [Acidimicrobiales bacterium]|nr:hypothetical protein [Acidimicrobiales bacterium]